MPLDEFFFALELPADPSIGLLRELIARICRTVCHVPEHADTLSNAIAAGVERAAAPGCQLRFEAQDGTLAVTVWDGPECTWRTTRPVD